MIYFKLDYKWIERSDWGHLAFKLVNIIQGPVRPVRLTVLLSLLFHTDNNIRVRILLIIQRYYYENALETVAVPHVDVSL
ncbi:hypothetical protein F2P81_011746 [Scophthalmus maximus]|uniref:Uncharacterized protein n=1 Tax=Scophthalmus maximus TaxID=52904 RepID=A0A6A4SZG8_SCOMX|nr:hypothetical protein F2P81_011746 [Scophthalmus maximus]